MGMMILLCALFLSGIFVLFPGRLSLHDRITGTAVYDLSSVRALVGDRGRFGWAFRTGAFEVMPVGGSPKIATES